MKDRFCLRKRSAPRGPHVITYSATLDVPAETATLLTELLVAERLRRGTGVGARAASARAQAIPSFPGAAPVPAGPRPDGARRRHPDLNRHRPPLSARGHRRPRRPGTGPAPGARARP